MKKLLSIIIILLATFSESYCQSNPVALKPGISINRIMNIRDGAIRLERDEVDGQIYYLLTSGEIYKIIIPQVGLPYDTLIATVANHGVQYVQGMVFKDSTWYLLGNNNSNTPLTYGILTRGKLQPNGSRTWDTLMHTANYETNGPFDHLFSGITLNPAGDTVYVASGARGDHGEILTRNGLYPGLRNTPLTTNVYAMPTHDIAMITLPNDSTLLANSGYVFARGARNFFDMAFDQFGNLFAVENSGDRDQNEEMNWLRAGKHYGFPWIMGDTYNPQQYTWFDPFADSLLNHHSRSWRMGTWTNDTTFPAPAPGQVFEAPIQNFGPDCDKFRDSLDVVHDASDEGLSIGTFTAHRSPLGLVFDNDNVLGPVYRGDAFMFSWTEGYDSTGSPPPPDSTHIGPFSDPSQDMVHLDLHYDSVAGNFTLNATRVIADFVNPVDAEIDSNKVYVIENGYGGTSGLFIVTLPVETNPCQGSASITTADICTPDSNTIIIPPHGMFPNQVDWYDTSGTLIASDSALMNADTAYNYPSGAYYAIVTDGGACLTDTIPFSIMHELTMTIDSVRHTTCIGCTDGQIFPTVLYGNPPYQYTPNPIGLPAGTYYFCVSDGNGCMTCDSVTILDDPTGVNNLSVSDGILLFPNPVKDFATVRLNSGSIDGIKIYNAKGAIQDVSIIKTNLNNEVSLNTENLESGIYTIELTNGFKKLHRNLIIIK